LKDHLYTRIGVSALIISGLVTAVARNNNLSQVEDPYKYVISEGIFVVNDCHSMTVIFATDKNAILNKISHKSTN